MNPQRATKIADAVDKGLARWQGYSLGVGEGMAVPVGVAVPLPVDHSRQVVRPMSRRKPLHLIDASHVTLPMPRRVVFKAGIFRPIARLGVWFGAGVRFFSGNVWDYVKGRASIQRRAVRLREIFEDTGASFAKLGQQLSLRADLLPYAYCAELSKMLDREPAFPSEQAIKIVERSLGRRLDEVFESFDPEPIGSASLACVYQAQLKTGERVAVKVRRPGIGPLLAADLRAMDWVLQLGELFTFIKPGLTIQFRMDLKKMLLGELNFRTEARYQEMFRLRADKDGDGITAPRVFFDYCTDEVMVSELVSGVWMWELMAAVDRDDHEFLREVAPQGIDPTAVARRLVRALHRDLLEHLFFHADPHPGNLVVLPGSRICFIDFGAIGRFSTETRNTWRELNWHMRRHDIARMVHSSMSLAGRLPPIDIDTVLKKLEDIYADWVYAVNSTDAEWWERSSAQNWLRYINVAREHGIPVSLETIQFFRATLLYDSIIVRLDKNVDPVTEWKSYAQVAAKDSRRRVRRYIAKRLGGPTRMDYLQIEQLADIATQVVFKFQRSVEDPIVHFRNIVGKIAYSLGMLLRLTYMAAAAVGLALITEYAAQRWFGMRISWSGILETMLSWAATQAIILLGALVVIRRVLIRMSEPDRTPGPVR
jgi:ubiquinone biosynthesis protein